MSRFAVVVSGLAFMLAACGKSSPPCTGATCLQVAGSYAITLNQSAGTSCKYIVYGGGVQAAANIAQTGSALTVVFSGSPVAQTLQGTLNEDGSANFSASGPITVEDDEGGSYSYQDTNIVNVTFTKGANGTITIAGTTSDTLSATMPTTDGIPDNNCILDGNLTGSD